MASGLAMDLTRPFPEWLETHLKSLNEDVDSCLVEYIVGMLDTDEDDDESLREGLSEILEEIAGDSTSFTTDLIVNNWKTYRDADRFNAAAAAAASSSSETFESVLASALEKQSIAEVKPQRKLTKDDEERMQVKEAILNLAAASAAADESEDEDGEGSEGAAKAASEEDSAAAPSLVPANMNVQKVLQEHKDKRDASQKQAEAKKAKDKEDREKQKNQKGDKADSEKKRTQKGEKRR